MRQPGRWFSGSSLRTRISLALVGLTLALGVVALVNATLDLTNILEERLENRGVAIAKDLAVRSGDPSQTNDVFGLYQGVNDTLLNNEDVRYIVLMEPSGDVRVHTFEDGVPPGLVEANTWDPTERQSVRHLNTNEGPLIDIAVPVLEGEGGVIRVGMSKAGVRGQVLSHLGRLSILVAIAVLGAIVLSILVSSLLTRPLARVAGAARRVGSGDLDTKVPVDADDEVGDLARAFNSMTEDLLHSRESLVQRNTELEILNSMAETLSRQLARGEVLDTSLERLLELTELSAAWVCVRGTGGRMELAASRGVLHPVSDHSAHLAEEHCPFSEVLETGRGIAVQAPPRCSLVGGANQTGEVMRSHAVIPLQSPDGVMGVLCVASADTERLDETLMRLLTSIGQQMGIALENANLYQELERKERIRTELLDKVINAQEEERMRVAREIHDEPSQALSGVILQLDKVGSRLRQQNGDERRDFDQVRRGVRAAMENLHRITTELRPRALDDLGLVPAIRWYAEERLREQGTQMAFKVAGKPGRLPPAIEIAVFRITQEAINNVAKHANATKVGIRLEFGDEVITGEIDDDGKGFSPQAVTGMVTEGAGLGLLGMQERAHLLGGQLSVTSSPRHGARVSFEIPLAERSFSHGQSGQGADSRRPRSRSRGHSQNPGG